jgi:hypothetical protein
MAGKGAYVRAVHALEEFLDEVDVSHDHSAAAVSFASQPVHCISVDLSVGGA